MIKTKRPRDANDPCQKYLPNRFKSLQNLETALQEAEGSLVRATAEYDRISAQLKTFVLAKDLKMSARESDRATQTKLLRAHFRLADKIAILKSVQFWLRKTLESATKAEQDSKLDRILENQQVQASINEVLLQNIESVARRQVECSAETHMLLTLAEGASYGLSRALARSTNVHTKPTLLIPPTDGS